MNPEQNMPKHIAVIMDGNGRWAKRRFMPRLAGHRAGVEAARQIVKNCARRGIQVLSLFAFSSENWRRPEKEVSHLMGLFLSGLENEASELHQNNVRLRFIGDRNHFSEKLVTKINEVEALTKENTGMTLLIAADYGGKWDIVQATKQISRDITAGKLSENELDETRFATYLVTYPLPEPDLFIRTSGEKRISNFMLWQMAYSELYFCDEYWPDFDEESFARAMTYYSCRERRFGQTSAQLVRNENA